MSTRQKVFALILVLSLLVSIHGELLAKIKLGAHLVVQKRDGQSAEGELIAVQQHALILNSRVNGNASIDIGEIKDIRIEKKSKALKALIGAAVGVAAGAFLGYVSYDEPTGWAALYDSGPGGAAMTTGILVGSIGLAIGVLQGRDKVLQIEGKSVREVSIILEHLRSKVRVPDYN